MTASGRRPVDGEEVFCLLGQRWNVAQALEVLAARPREAGTVPVAAAGQMLGLIGVDPEHARTVDLTRPVVTAWLPPGEDGRSPGRVVIDGWHRLARAVADGVEDLPALALDEQESEAVRIP